MNAVSRWTHLKYVLLFRCRCREPIRQFSEWKGKCSPIHAKTQSPLLHHNLFHIVIVTHSSFSAQTHPTVGACARVPARLSLPSKACQAQARSREGCGYRAEASRAKGFPFLRRGDWAKNITPDRLPLLASNLSLSSRLHPQTSATVARDLQHGIGQLPRQNLAVEVRQNIVSAACAECATWSGITRQLQDLVCEKVTRHARPHLDMPSSSPAEKPGSCVNTRPDPKRYS